MKIDTARLEPKGPNLYVAKDLLLDKGSSSLQTQSVFSDKWERLTEHLGDDTDEPWKNFQLSWFLTLYGFSSQEDFREYLQNSFSSPLFVDAGCGKGYKSAWIGGLSPNAEVVGIDFSTSVSKAASRYEHASNVLFMQADIANLPITDGVVDLIICDQVLHHTQNPVQTLQEFFRILKPGGILLTYVYRKKALPRELLDEHFRRAVHALHDDEIWKLAKGMTELGKLLSENDVELDFPDIPALGISGGRQSLQRFMYWNFFKCFWNNDLGYEACLSINYDWYSPSIAFRYSREEFLAMIHGVGFSSEFIHEEQACLSGRFVKTARS
jgi:ubiquinone/menaquinone biosynthesis C-methylase UbiE